MVLKPLLWGRESGVQNHMLEFVDFPYRGRKGLGIFIHF
jgi:hypothetical protein